MRRALTVASSLAGLALIAAGAGMARATAAQDTCTATGNGTSYTLAIAIPNAAAPQYGFAVGAPGAQITNTNVSGTDGSLSTANLPANTTGAWLTSSPVPKATLTLTVTTTAAVSGAFTVVPAISPSSFAGAIRCALAQGSRLASSSFSVARTFSYRPATRSWHLLVTIPGPGIVSAEQAVAANQVMAPKPLVESSKVTAKSAGRFALNLSLTGAGKKELSAKGSLRLRLSVTFAPTNGKPATKTFLATLRTSA